jgi:hypothetical protein
VEEEDQTLLGHRTATELGIFKITVAADIEHVNTVTSNNLKKSVVERYPKVFTGVGKLKNFQLRSLTFLFHNEQFCRNTFVFNTNICDETSRNC